MTDERGPKPGDFIKAVRIKGERHNITFPVGVMKALRVSTDDYVTFEYGERAGEVIVRAVKARPPSN